MKTRKQMVNFVLLALFIALIFLLGQTPLGLIPLGFINVTILCVPVIIGTLMLGLKSGLFLGFMFGCVSVFAAITRPSALVSTLLGASPALVVVMSMLPRLLVPLAAHVAFRLLLRIAPASSAGRARKSPTAYIAAAAAAALGSLTNTVFYLGLMLLFYVLCGISTTQVLTLIGGTALIAGSLEATANAVICPAVYIALSRTKLRV